MRPVAAILALPVLAAVTAFASPPGPDAGVHEYNQQVCGRQWVSIHVPETSYFSAYPGAFGQGAVSCITPEEHHLDFAVSAASGSGFHAYPNISSGWESGRYTCTGHKGACFRCPVQVSHDGDPVTSVAGWLAPGRYDFSYDVWFNKTDAHPLQDDGAEIMVWLAHPGIREACPRTVVISGIEWCVTGWRTHHPGEPSWNLVIYYAVDQRSSAHGLWLNEFFRDAIAHGQLSPDWWLTGIDAGFELVAGGLRDNVHHYSLTGLYATAGGR